MIFISICRSRRDLSFDMFYVVRYQLELLFFASEKLNIFEFLKSRKLIDLVRIFNFLVEKTCYFGMLLRGAKYGPKKFSSSKIEKNKLHGIAYWKNQPQICDPE
jgi:hypothetical protein